MENKEQAFLGTGWSFPPEFHDQGKEIQMVSGATDVQQSLEILLGTRLNERILQEEFGSNLHDFTFAEINAGIINLLRTAVNEAILYHELRVEVNSIELNLDEQRSGLLWIQLDYSIPASNSRFNMVYPFYLEEANF